METAETAIATAITDAVHPTSEAEIEWVRRIAEDILAGTVELNPGAIIDRIARDGWIPGRGTPTEAIDAFAVDGAVRGAIAAYNATHPLSVDQLSALEAEVVATTAAYETAVREWSAAGQRLNAAEASARSSMWAGQYGLQRSYTAESEMRNAGAESDTSYIAMRMAWDAMLTARWRLTVVTI